MDRPSIFSDNFEMMNGFFDDSFWGSHSGLRTMTTMATDIFETKDGYEIEMDLPGFPKESIKAELKGGYLTILASYTGSDREDREGSYIKRNGIPVTIREAFMLATKSVNKILKQDLQMVFCMSMYQNSTTNRK